MSQVSWLLIIFEEFNKAHFDSFLEPPILRWNSRLRSSAGRFIPGVRQKFWFSGSESHIPPIIEIASYLKEEENSDHLVKDTMGHEMIHYWLWVRKKPYGHTEEFWKKMKEMGVSRYNTVPRRTPPKYLYRCPSCMKEFPARRRLSKKMACLKCCKQFSDGKYDARFALLLV